MSTQTGASLQGLLGSIRTCESASFYRDLWGSAQMLQELPEVSREDFIRVPLSQRRYKMEKSLVKIVHDGSHAFLSEWSFKDIAREPFGMPSKRPMVQLSDPHEAIEKSMWCYENNMLPLIGEKDADIAMFAARKYHIDSLITDADAIGKLLPYLRERSEVLESISILGGTFDIASLLPYCNFAKSVRLVRTLPETGAFAEAELEEQPVFRVSPHCVVEEADTFVVTKIHMLVTPAIRYRTNIRVRA